LLKDAESQWAPPTDSVFSLVPTRCEEHISSVYAQLGSPEVGFHTFWDIYNQVRNAVDSEFLFESSGGVDEDTGSEETRSENPDANQPPLQHLRACEFGENGIPPMQYEEGEAEFFFRFCAFMI
jgi:hypothetical protein